MTSRRRSPGRDTKAEAQRLALTLFIAQGYQATSLREIAEGLGITKASLYYHFSSKDDIVRSVLEDRTAEAQALLDWVQAQVAATPEPTTAQRRALTRAAVSRWTGHASAEKIQGIRFLTANPTVLRELGQKEAPDQGTGGRREGHLGSLLEQVVRLLVGPDLDPARVVVLRSALLSLNVAVMAAQDAPDETIAGAARQIADGLLGQLDAG